MIVVVAVFKAICMVAAMGYLVPVVAGLRAVLRAELNDLPSLNFGEMP